MPDLVGILKNLLDLFLIKPFVKDLSESVVRIQKYLSGEKLYSELAIKVWTISLVLFWGYHILRLHSAQWYGIAANITNFVRKANFFLNQ